MNFFNKNKFRKNAQHPKSTRSHVNKLECDDLLDTYHGEKKNA